MSVCSLRNPAGKCEYAKSSSVAYPVLKYFSILPHKRADLKKMEHEMCVLITVETLYVL